MYVEYKLRQQGWWVPLGKILYSDISNYTGEGGGSGKFLESDEPNNKTLEETLTLRQKTCAK